jgi:hypothetical protein
VEPRHLSPILHRLRIPERGDNADVTRHSGRLVRDERAIRRRTARLGAEKRALWVKARAGDAREQQRPDPSHHVSRVPQIEQLAILVLDGGDVGGVAIGLERRVAVRLLDAEREEPVRLYLRVLLFHRRLRVHAIRLACAGGQYLRHMRSQL